MEIKVKGHSGCNIEIVSGGSGLYINKSTSDSKYVERLYKQALKQQEASNIPYQHIRIPKVFNIEKKTDFLNIKMEYVYSKNYIDYFEDAGFEQIEYFIHALKIFVDSEISNSEIKRIPSKVLEDKFVDVNTKILNNQLIKNDKEILAIMKVSAIVFSQMEKELCLPIGQCHGDLTFSNILFNGNNYYLIDFLDSFIESPLCDIVKIRQDSCFSWSQMMYTHKFDRVRMDIISKKIDEEIDRYYSKYKWYSKYYRELQLMNLLRVLQYAKEESVVEFLKKTIKTLL